MWREIRRENNKGRKGPSPHLVLIAYEGEKTFMQLNLSIVLTAKGGKEQH